jgi:hypothetical protein
MSLELELEQLRTKYAEKEAQLKREHEILALFGDTLAGYEKPMVCFHKLYRRRGTVAFNHCRYQSIQKGKNPDSTLMRTLLEQFPPVPILQYKDGCISFRPQVVAEADAAAVKDGRTVTLYECGPVIVRLEPSHYSQSAKFEWTCELGGELWDIALEYNIFGVDLGILTLYYDTYQDGEVKRVRICEFRPKWDAQRIRWASGDHKTPNSFTLFWDRDTAAKLDYPAMVKDTGGYNG